MALPAVQSPYFQRAIAQVCRRRTDDAVDRGLSTRLAVPKNLPISEKHFRSGLKRRSRPRFSGTSIRGAKHSKAVLNEL